MQKGLIQVYTGDGKGKTTASVGLVVRAMAHSLKICYIYFHKNLKGAGEHKVLRELGVDLFGFAEEHPHFSKGKDREALRQECLEALKFIKEIYKKGYDILVLDEINISIRDGFLREEEVIEVLKEKPDGLEVILTGRGAPEGIIEFADLVSEIREIKHPYKFNIQSRRGIEY